MLSSIIFRSLIHGGSLTSYSPFWTILILHLLIIWATTWVLVPSDTLSSFLWVVIVKATLFKGLLHINAAKKLATWHSMRWQQLFLRYFLASTLPIRSWCTSLSAKFPGMSLLSNRIYVWSVFCLSNETLLLGPHFLTFPLACYLQDFELNTLTMVYSSSDQSTSSAKAQGPIYNFGPLFLQHKYLIKFNK